jgi:hypothetical protein
LNDPFWPRDGSARRLDRDPARCARTPASYCNTTRCARTSSGRAHASSSHPCASPSHNDPTSRARPSTGRGAPCRTSATSVRATLSHQASYRRAHQENESSHHQLSLWC